MEILRKLWISLLLAIRQCVEDVDLDSNGIADIEEDPFPTFGNNI